MANCQVLKMFHLGRNVTLTYSVVTVLRQRFNQRLGLRSIVGNTRACTYHSSSERSDILKTEMLNGKGKHYSDRNKNRTKRVLTESLIKENKEFKDSFEVLSEEDSFGTMSESFEAASELNLSDRTISNKDSLRRSEKDKVKNNDNGEVGRETNNRYKFNIESLSGNLGKRDPGKKNLGIRDPDRENLRIRDQGRGNLGIRDQERGNLGIRDQGRGNLGIGDPDRENLGIRDQERVNIRIRDQGRGNLGIRDPDRENLGIRPDPKVRMYNKMKYNTSAKTGKKIRQKTEDTFSDSFGTLNLDDDIKLLTYEEEKTVDAIEGDEVENPHRRLHFSRNNRNHLFYARKIIRKGKQGKVKEAISILEDRMLVEDRVQPSQYVFTLVIGICGRVGYTAKAFSLFNKMKKMGLQPEDPTYTALFNACANSPLKGDGLKRAENLRELMAVKGYEPSFVTYKAMIKAFGFSGDMKTAFLIADEASRKFKLDLEFFSHLLISPISDKEAGFRHAIQIWRMMRQKGLRPCIYHYNLMLRAVGECGIGDQEFIQDFIPTGQTQVPGIPIDMTTPGQNIDTSSMITSDETVDTHLQITSGESVNTSSKITSSQNIDTSSISDEDKSSIPGVNAEESDLEWWQYDIKTNKPKLNEQKALTTHQFAVDIPDILNPNENYMQIVSLGKIQTSEDRMMLLGGMSRYLRRMDADGVVANVITYNQLLLVLPSTEVAENELFDRMEMANVKPDIDMFNLLIFRRHLRNDVEKAWEVKSMIEKNKLTCNMKTFKYFALLCKRMDNADKLLQEMEAAGLEPDIMVMTSFLKASLLDFTYKKFVLHQMEKYNIQPDEIFLNRVEKQIQTARRKMLKNEEGHTVFKTENYSQQFTKFRHFYDGWLQRMEIQTKEHPWHSFSKAKDKESSFIEM